MRNQYQCCSVQLVKNSNVLDVKIKKAICHSGDPARIIRLDVKIKKAIRHSGDPARIIRNPVKSIAYWIPDNRYAVSGMTKTG